MCRFLCVLHAPMRIFLLAIFISFSLHGQAQKASLIKLDNLSREIETSRDQIQVYNFWATWCAPCVKELPFFEKVNADVKEVRVTLVSMDMDLDPNPEKVYKFIARKNIRSRVVILDEKDPNAWINKIDGEWNGALPATLVVNNKTGERRFVQKGLQEGELEKLIDEVK